MALVTAHAASGLRVASTGCLSADGVAGCVPILSRAAPSPAPETCKGASAVATLPHAGVLQPESRSQPACLSPLSRPVTEAGAESPWKPPPHRA